MLGVDLIFIPEFNKQLKLGGNAFIAKTFNKNELKSKSIEHLAGVWAAKEAVFKASGIELSSWLDIKITYNRVGKPSAKLNDEHFEISISHHGEYVVAVAIGAHNDV